MTSGPPATLQRSERISRWLVVASVLVLLIGLLGTFVKLPYAIEYPGIVVNTLGDEKAKTISVEGAKTYPTEGSLYFTTVSVVGGPERHVNVWEWVRGHLDDDAVVLPEEEVFGSQTSDEEVRQRNTAQMQGSQDDAEAIGIRSTGTKVPQRNLVAQVADGLPADGQLEPDDEIRSVDGEGVDRVADITAAISDRPAGEDVRLGIVRDGAAKTVTLTTTDLGGGRSGIGVGLRAAYDYPYEVRIDAGDVGGPSAGMMFSLAVHDVLTPGPLTGGAQIAGTGTIDDSGAVGRIGGIRQKLIGAADGDADYFLAPEGNCDEVVGHVPEGLQVVSVSTFDDALAATKAIADDDATDLPTCR